MRIATDNCLTGNRKPTLSAYSFGMPMPDKQYSSNSYRYGFNGKENDNEVHNGIVGGWQDYGMRCYNTRLGRFFSLDPILSEYPELTPYQFASNRPIDGFDLDGNEYKSAAKWAETNMKGWISNWANRTYYSFNNYAKPEIQSKVKATNALNCYESVLIAYASGNPLVFNYLKNNGYAQPDQFVASRIHAYEWFKKGGKHHSFISSHDFAKADVGDVLFKGEWGGYGGHAAIVYSKPKVSDDGNTFTIDLLTTESNKNAEYGVKTYTFKKIENKWYDYTSGKQGQELKGFGRIDEEGIKKDAAKDAEKKTTGEKNEVQK